MFPVLFEIPVLGGVRIYTYGVLVALAFMVGSYWTTHEAKIAPKPAAITPDQVLDLSFYIILAALAGSRVLYIIVDWDRYASHPLDVLKIWEGGLVFYGGLIGAMLISLWYFKKHRLRFLKVADLFMPGVALGHAIGRLGCLSAGCCYGRESQGFPLSIIFPQNHFSLAPAGVSLFPSQLMESATALAIFFTLIFMRKKKKFDGQIFLSYIVLYGISRSILEVFRGDSLRGFLIPNWLSTSQFISGCLIIIAIIIYRQLRKKQEGGGIS